MGKGKAKGFRPPKDDNSMLFGSAAHLTGNSIASPVQLRAEGVALPKDHLNFGDEWGKGDKAKGAAKGAKGADAATGSNQVELGPKAEGAEPEVKAEEPKKAEPAKIVIESSRPVANDGLSEIERRRAGMQEIERRRAAMLQREVASQQTEGAEHDPEARRQAMERGRRQAQAKGEVKDEPGFGSVKEEREADMGEAADGEVDRIMEGAERADGEEAQDYDDDEEDEVSLAAARRRRLEEEEGQQQDVKKPRTDAPADTGAMKQGLQGWAEQVNALAADGSNAELAQACRDFVRKRILRAHMEGNLHSVDWGAEVVPLPEELLLGLEAEG